MANPLELAVIFDIIAVIFGILALFYAYKGYVEGGKEAGLKTWAYFFGGMIGMATFVIFDYLRVTGIIQGQILIGEQIALAATAILVFLGFKDMYKFFSSID